MYNKINWQSRMIGLIGPRGVGKTTLVLQYIKQNLNPAETLYVSAEDFYFVDNRITELVDTFAKYGGKYLFIDEIHKYKDWAKELKLSAKRVEIKRKKRISPIISIDCRDFFVFYPNFIRSN